MTNFAPLKSAAWKAARAGDSVAFEKACDNLMKKACEDIWRLGWQLYPKKIEDVYDMLDRLAKWFHELWLKAMENGDAPPEDVSPAEGVALVKKVIQDAVDGTKRKRSKKKGAVKACAARKKTAKK